MKTLLKSTLAAASALALSVGAAGAEPYGDRAQIEEILSTYEAALNASDTNAILPLYTEGGVFMAQHSLPNVGKDAIRAAYDDVFQAIELDIGFIVDEVLQVAPEWAFARTRSEGFVTVNATGDKGPEANQELFVFQKQDDGEWKIARYIFSTTNPARH